MGKQEPDTLQQKLTAIDSILKGYGVIYNIRMDEAGVRSADGNGSMFIGGKSYLDASVHTHTLVVTGNKPQTNRLFIKTDKFPNGKTIQGTLTDE